MKEVKEIKTVTYEYKDGFMVDIVIKPDIYEVWLYHEQYGIKELQFGGMLGSGMLESIEETLKANIDEYIESYKDKYMD